MSRGVAAEPVAKDPRPLSGVDSMSSFAALAALTDGLVDVLQKSAPATTTSRHLVSSPVGVPAAEVAPAGAAVSLGSALPVASPLPQTRQIMEPALTRSSRYSPQPSPQLSYRAPVSYCTPKLSYRAPLVKAAPADELNSSQRAASSTAPCRQPDLQRGSSPAPEVRVVLSSPRATTRVVQQCTTSEAPGPSMDTGERRSVRRLSSAPLERRQEYGSVVGVLASPDGLQGSRASIPAVARQASQQNDSQPQLSQQRLALGARISRQGSVSPAPSRRSALSPDLSSFKVPVVFASPAAESRRSPSVSRVAPPTTTTTSAPSTAQGIARRQAPLSPKRRSDVQRLFSDSGSCLSHSACAEAHEVSVLSRSSLPGMSPREPIASAQMPPQASRSQSTAGVPTLLTAMFATAGPRRGQATDPLVRSCGSVSPVCPEGKDTSAIAPDTLVYTPVVPQVLGVQAPQAPIASPRPTCRSTTERPGREDTSRSTLTVPRAVPRRHFASREGTVDSDKLDQSSVASDSASRVVQMAWTPQSLAATGFELRPVPGKAAVVTQPVSSARAATSEGRGGAQLRARSAGGQLLELNEEQSKEKGRRARSPVSTSGMMGHVGARAALQGSSGLAEKEPDGFSDACKRLQQKLQSVKEDQGCLVTI